MGRARLGPFFSRALRDVFASACGLPCRNGRVTGTRLCPFVSSATCVVFASACGLPGGNGRVTRTELCPFFLVRLVLLLPLPVVCFAAVYV